LLSRAAARFARCAGWSRTLAAEGNLAHLRRGLLGGGRAPDLYVLPREREQTGHLMGNKAPLVPRFCSALVMFEPLIQTSYHLCPVCSLNLIFRLAAPFVFLQQARVQMLDEIIQVTSLSLGMDQPML
jgi:hypothetical protein